MITQIYTCDLCKREIDKKTEDFLTLDGYWNMSNTFIEDMNFHTHCWEKVLGMLREYKK